MELNVFGGWAVNPGVWSWDWVWVAVKWMLVLGLAVYTIVALVVIKQVAIMSETLEDPANWVVRWFARAHFLYALVLTVLTVVVG